MALIDPELTFDTSRQQGPLLRSFSHPLMEARWQVDRPKLPFAHRPWRVLRELLTGRPSSRVRFMPCRSSLAPRRHLRASKTARAAVQIFPFSVILCKWRVSQPILKSENGPRR
jgi:hypothetical protein